MRSHWAIRRVNGEASSHRRKLFWIDSFSREHSCASTSRTAPRRVEIYPHPQGHHLHLAPIPRHEAFRNSHNHSLPLPAREMAPQTPPRAVAFASSFPVTGIKPSSFLSSPAASRPLAPRRHSAVSLPPFSMTMTAFRKYHGIGNDFVLVDNRSQKTPVFTAEQSVAICDRNRGVGADGVIFLLPPKNGSSDFTMRLYNSDGTEPEMCGNGIRCLAKFADDLDVPSATPGKFVIDTGAGVIVPEIVPDSSSVKVDMGEPIIDPKDVPTLLDTSESAAYETILNVKGRDWMFSCVSMGNPHAISFVTKEVFEEVDANLEEIGPDFECNPVFPQKTNTEFAFQRRRTEFDMTVWERGAGRTQACGTGACAVLVAAVLTGRADYNEPTVIHLPGGDLTIEWVSKTNHIIMTGPAELVFDGNLANA